MKKVFLLLLVLTQMSMNPAVGKEPPPKATGAQPVGPVLWGPQQKPLTMAAPACILLLLFLLLEHNDADHDLHQHPSRLLGAPGPSP